MGSAVGWLIMGASASAQITLAQSTCAGPGAETLIRESFGTTQATPSLTGRTTYRFVTKSCPNNGEYAIASTSDNTCFDNVWHRVSQDHTGNVGGNMLIVNASDLPGEFYRQTIPGLCGGTTYEFSVWGLNLLQPGNCTESSLPNLSIQIETESGRRLRTIDVGTISETRRPEWRRFAVSFTMPDVDEPVLVKLINKAEAGGCGNDLALDDIELLRCSTCPPDPVFVPDAFSPNNDGQNDRLAVYLETFVTVRVELFDRWGTLLYASTTLTEQWDGTFRGQPCPVGQYTWRVTYEAADSPTTTSTYARAGQVLLLR
jgi:gliding motility-associated-like protein